MRSRSVYLLLTLTAGVALYALLNDTTRLERLLQASDQAGGIETVSLDDTDGFDLQSLAEPERIVIVEFYTKRCPGCRRLHQHFQRFLPLRPDVVVKRVEMPDDWTPEWAANRYQLAIGSTPHIVIFDAQGVQLAADDGLNKKGFALLYQWMNTELRKQWEERNR